MTTPSSWLAEALTPLIQGIKADIKKLGDLSTLQTGDKTSLVAAINWLKNHQPVPVATRLKIGKVVTGLPGLPAQAEIVGEAPEQTLSLTIPKGDAGPVSALSMVGDRLAIDGVAVGPHLTGPAGADGVPGQPGTAGHTPILAWGSGDDADCILIDGEASGPHLTGPAGDGAALPDNHIVPGYYTKPWLDARGVAQWAEQLAQDDIPALPITRISGLDSSLALKQPITPRLSAILELDGSGVYRQLSDGSVVLDDGVPGGLSGISAGWHSGIQFNAAGIATDSRPLTCDDIVGGVPWGSLTGIPPIQPASENLSELAAIGTPGFVYRHEDGRFETNNEVLTSASDVEWSRLIHIPSSAPAGWLDGVQPLNANLSRLAGLAGGGYVKRDAATGAFSVSAAVETADLPDSVVPSAACLVVSYSAKGLVTGGRLLVSSDIPTIGVDKVSGLGSAATRNVAAGPEAGPDEVVLGSDPRLSGSDFGWGSGADADRITIGGVATGPHLTGPTGPTGATGATGATGPTYDITGSFSWSPPIIAVGQQASIVVPLSGINIGDYVSALSANVNLLGLELTAECRTNSLVAFLSNNTNLPIKMREGGTFYCGIKTNPSASSPSAAVNTLDPSRSYTSGLVTLSNGNLTYKTSGDTAWRSAVGTVFQNYGVRSCRFHVDSASGAWNMMIGVCDMAAATTTYIGVNEHGWSWDYNSGSPVKFHSALNSAYGSSWGAGDTLEIEVDFTVGTVTCYKLSGGIYVSQGIMYSGLVGPLTYSLSLVGGTLQVTVDPAGWV